jgi:predicted transcriptional regulator
MKERNCWVTADGDNVDRLFFELASESRIGILRELQIKELKMQELARKLALTDTETCRQLQRLTEAKMVQKQSDATYLLTSYGRFVLEVTSPMDFISRHREYFLNHDASLLPAEFRARLAEISDCEFLPSAAESINRATEAFLTAQERIDSVIQGGIALIEVLRKRSLDGVKIRWLMLESFVPKAPSALDSWKKLPEIRITPMPLGLMLVTEKEANFNIRQNDGKIDFVSFHGTSPSFMKWVNDLWMHEWEKAKPWRP